MPELEKRAAAGFFPRAAALLIDRVLLGVVLLLVRLPALIASLNGESFLLLPFLFRYTLLDVIAWVASAAYFVLLTAFTGATLGKRAMGLQVVTAEGGRPSFWTVLYRETIGRYLSSILCIGYFLVLGDARHRALHDMLCDTQVVYTVPHVSSVTHTPTVLVTDDPRRDWYKPYRV